MTNISLGKDSSQILTIDLTRNIDSVIDSASDSWEYATLSSLDDGNIQNCIEERARKLQHLTMAPNAYKVQLAQRTVCSSMFGHHIFRNTLAA